MVRVIPYQRDIRAGARTVVRAFSYTRSSPVGVRTVVRVTTVPPMMETMKMAEDHAVAGLLLFIQCMIACRGGLVFKAHRLLHHSTLGLRAIKKKNLSSQCVIACQSNI